ncbi:MAG: biopolymer transporter ExbD [Fibromonadaceae bacterium]|jgi:biopolymer transport protein ExbD|nr:biopolymer transporter ExbD [Fibromonadaceae bacterium]
MKLAILLIAIGFMFGCTDQNAYLIRVEQDAVFVGNKKVANTNDVAKQDSFLVEALHKALQALESKKDTSKNCQIKIDPEQSYNVFYKIANTCKLSGYTKFSIISKINGEDYTQFFSLNNKEETFFKNFEGPPFEVGILVRNLTVVIDKDYFEIRALGGHSPKIFHKENLDFAYNELANLLIKVHNLTKDSYFDGGIGYIEANNDIKISNLIPVMHGFRTAGVTTINLLVYKRK